ncbi:integrase [Microbacterium sp. BE35]|uniref:tyrosine-type recombinase/integrase n=1 Tax=Microbacterium sp. BE35 TaxID=2817773 RepID=UPI00285F1AC4|nr:tyrosine-type recombinase/integrase [Microbacterium sp. BE35]MDR7189841.1 integrase [Microbacterium sp. BE35]
MVTSTPRRPRRRHSFGAIRQLPSGNYQAWYVIDGEKFKAPVTFPSRTAAQRWLDCESADRWRGDWFDHRRGQRKLADYAAEWLALRPDLAPRTRDVYQHSLDRWILPQIDAPGQRSVRLADVPLAELTPALIGRWYATVVIAARASSADRRGGGRRVQPARTWARANGYDVADSGRLSPSLTNAWQRAGSPDVSAQPAASPDDQAGRTAAKRAFDLLRAILNSAVRQELIDRNPCHAVTGTMAPRRRERGVATPDEVRALAELFPARLRAAVLLAAWSGLRHGELFGLARRHIDLDNGTVTVTRALLIRPGHAPSFGSPKTARSARTVNLPGFVLAELRNHMANYTDAFPDALVFTTEAGTPESTSTTSRLMRRARRGIDREDLTWHDLRHTGATLAYTTGASVPEVQRRLGHATQAAAAVYQHVFADRDQLLAARLNDLYGDAPSTPRAPSVATHAIGSRSLDTPSAPDESLRSIPA